MGLSALFEVQEKRIICLTTGAMIIYHGLRDLNVASIKSFEGIDIVWVEEGHKVTKMSWNTLINTIRAPQSEIWVTFNPELDTDETYRRFVLRPPSDAFVQKVTFEDNAMRSAVLESERRRMQEQDPDEYDNVYLGNPRSAVIGAIYEREIAQLIQSRFRPVPYDPQLLVHTAWDLGWNDQTTIIFAQRLISEVRIIDYEEASFQRADQWADRLAQRGYAYGGHWLPHDADHETLAGGGVSLKKQLRSLFAQARVGGQLHVIPRVPDENQRIRAARQMFPRVYMDSDKCERLLECLRRFRRAKPETTGEEGAPVKDEYKHGADAFGELARIVDKLGNELQPKMVFRQHRISNPRIGY
jgi:phage terminase large subunit